MEVSLPMAKFFMDQIVGLHNGHMASIPNNPVLQSMIIAYFGTYKIDSEQFREFLNGVSEALRKEEADSLSAAQKIPSDFPF